MSGIEFEGVKKNPFANKEVGKTTRMVNKYLEGAKELKHRLRPDQAEARVKIKTPKEVARIMLISDLHFGSEATDMKLINQIIEELDEPDTYAILAGDILDGVKQEYMSTTVGGLFNFQEQVDILEVYLVKKLLMEKY